METNSTISMTSFLSTVQGISFAEKLPELVLCPCMKRMQGFATEVLTRKALDKPFRVLLLNLLMLGLQRRDCLLDLGQHPAVADDRLKTC